MTVSRRSTGIVLDRVIKDSLVSFTQYVAEPPRWWGREYEAVSLFAIRFLAAAFREVWPDFDAGQIGLNVAVPQLSREEWPSHRIGRKADVCKDIVIWPNPKMTAFTEERIANKDMPPLAVLEWKSQWPPPPGGLRPSPYDLEWLKAFTRRYTETSGYCVTFGISKGEVSANCVLLRRGVESQLLDVHRTA
jgi:hypothetical protein